MKIRFAKYVRRQLSEINYKLYLENFIQNDDKIYFIKTSENTNILKCNNRSKDRL